jgi:hypothetical protein
MAITRAQQAKQMLQSGGEVLGPLGEDSLTNQLSPGTIGRGLAFVLSGGLSGGATAMAKELAKQKIIDEAQKKVGDAIRPRLLTQVMQEENRARGIGGYQSDFAQDSGFMGGKGTAAEMGSFADGGRIGLQEGGGIEQRLEQLGGDVTSAEQMLQGINQRLKTAESSLGSGGGGLGSLQQPAVNAAPFMGRPALTEMPGYQGPLSSPTFVGELKTADPLQIGNYDLTKGAQIPEQFREGYAEFMKGKPIPMGGQALSSVRLPGGGSVTFGDTGSAASFRDYLKSTGFTPPGPQPLPANVGVFQSRPENTTGLTAAIPPGTTPNLEDLYPNTGVQLNAEPMPRGGYRFGAFENRDIVGIPAASYADGGNVVGGEYDFESARQMYGLGKLVKKVTRTVKKIAKSPIGKAALLYAGTAGLGSLGAGKGFGSLFKLGTYAPSTVGANLGTAFTRFVGGKLAPNLVDEVALTGKQNLFQRALGAFPGGGVGAALTATSLLPLLGLGTGEESEEEAEELIRGSGLDIAAIRANPNQFLGRRFRAEGGSMKEPVAKKTMPLLDMGGKEMDLRAEGGFVPIGRMEKADDVPARLSKNEFVFTADAVRNAGDGDVDKGAEVMYNMMKNLESGGDVSEESQGLKGARKMFQTSQRLEEVL